MSIWLIIGICVAWWLIGFVVVWLYIRNEGGFTAQDVDDAEGKLIVGGLVFAISSFGPMLLVVFIFTGLGRLMGPSTKNVSKDCSTGKCND